MAAKKTTKKTAAKKTAKSADDATKAPATKKTAVKKTAAKKAAKKALPKSEQTKSVKKAAPSIDSVARSAYLNYRRRVENGLPGDSHGDWLEAERQLTEQA